MQLVVSATPGTGKSTITKNAEEYGLNHCHVHYDNHTREYELTVPNSSFVPVFDSDSSLFDKTEFPGNYIKHIKEVLAKFPDVVIFVSSHDNVREAMAEAGIKYVLAYPERELKGDYLERYKERGSPEKFITLMDEKWNDFIDSVQADKAERHLVLSEGEFLVDVLKSDLEAVTSKVDNVFSTAIISGNESIGDVVCDDVGQPVAVWGSNGLEPLPSEEPIADVVVVADPLAVATPDPVPDAPLEDDTPKPDFSTAIITGTESIGDTVYNDIGTAVAVVGEVGLEPILAPVVEVVPVVEVEPVDTGIAPEVLVDVNAEPTEEPPAAMDPQDTPVPVTSIPEQMQSPDPVPPVAGQPAVDASEVQAPATEVEVVVDPGAGTAQVDVTVDGQEDLPQPAEVPKQLQEMDRLELIENFNTIEDDITTIQAVVDVCQTDKRDGLEGVEDGGAIFVQAAADIKARYKADVEPTLAGFEGFLDSLKNAFSAIGEALKGKPNKEHLAKIKKYMGECDTAINQYSSETWLGKQEFYNVGKTKMQVPNAFKDVTDLDGIAKIIDIYLKALDVQFEAQDKVIGPRFKAALPVFNKLKNRKPDDEDKDLKELNKYVPIKPDRIAMSKPGDLDALLKVTAEKGELPVLTKDKIKEVVELIKTILAMGDKWDDQIEKHVVKGLSYDDFSDSEFFDTYSEEVGVVELEVSLVWESSCSALFEIQGAYARAMLPVCKFLEMWILNSTK